MGKRYERIDGRIRTFIEEQPVFFTATAPLATDGHVNLSPKGRAGTLVVIDELTLAYLDFGGSGAETIAHLRENGRITLMWCAFTGPPKVLRVHGRGSRSSGTIRAGASTSASSRTPTGPAPARSS